MANQLYPILPRVVDTNIDASPGAKLTFYVSGTTTPVTVYTTEACDVAHPSPLVANADGSVPPIWLQSGAAKVVVTDANDASLFTIDPVVATAGAGLTAADIPFSPTVDLPYTDTQAAIEGAAASAVSGYAVFGIGITGNATLLASIDATNIGAGAYRFDNTTTGTFPTGVSAADGGIIEHWRQASGAAMQMLFHATTDRVFHRRMASSTWGTWREVITLNQGAVEGDIIYRAASAWARLAKGAAYKILGQNAALTAPEWQDRNNFVSSKSTASGSGPFSFTIPAQATRIDVIADGISLSWTDNLLVQLSTGASYVTTGYVSYSSASGLSATSTAGFVVQGTTASNAWRGTMTLWKIPGTNRWISKHDGSYNTGGDDAIGGSGAITMAGSIDGIRLTKTGTDTFDGAGSSVSVVWS